MTTFRIKADANDVVTAFESLGLTAQTETELNAFLVRGKSIPDGSEKNRVEQAIRGQSDQERHTTNIELHSAAGGAIQHLRTTGIVVEEIGEITKRATGDLNEAFEDGIQRVQREVSRKQRLEREIDTIESTHGTMSVDPSAQRNAVMLSSFVGFLEVILNMFGIFSSGSIEGGLIASLGLSGLLTLINVCGGVTSGIALQYVFRPATSRTFKFLSLSWLSVIVVVALVANVLAALERSNGGTLLDLGSIGIVTFGAFVFSMNAKKWFSVPRIDPRLANLYSKHKKAEVSVQSTYEDTILELTGIRDKSCVALQGDGDRELGWIGEHSENVAESKAALQIVNVIAADYYTVRQRSQSFFEGLITHHRAVVREAVGNQKPLPAYFQEKVDLTELYARDEEGLNGLGDAVEQLNATFLAAQKQTLSAVEFIDARFEEVVGRFRTEAQRLMALTRGQKADEGAGPSFGTLAVPEIA